jgi:hypothetical protein
MIRREPVLDLLGRRHHDRHVALHEGLAGEGVPGFHVGPGESENAATPHSARFHPHGAASTASLSATGLLDVDPQQASSFDQQGVRPHGGGLGTPVESDDVVGHGDPRFAVYPCVNTVFM